jgi:hypothetical protein
LADWLTSRLAREDHVGDKQKVLQEAADAYGELREAVASLDEAQARVVWLGTWGVKEILIHISAWDREIAPAFARIDRGEPAYPAGTYDDFDAWNARFVEAGKHAQGAEILADLEASHRGLVAASGGQGIARRHGCPALPRARRADPRVAERHPLASAPDTPGHVRGGI